MNTSNFRITIITSFLSGAVGAFLVIVITLQALAQNPSLFKTGFLPLLQNPGAALSQNTPGKPGSGSDLATGSQESRVVAAVRKAKPAVVSIVISKDVPIIERYYEDNPFGNFFNFQIPQYRQNGTQKQDVGGGSGFLVSSDGLIVTNKHVVSDTAADYTVFTNDGKKYTATIVARDPVNDLSILKIDGKDLPFLQFGDSDTLEPGQSVLAIGNALAEFQNSVSVGIISGLSRSITAGDGSGQSETLDNVIQTDAAINPGNSGGPLLNLEGNVVGVNVAIVQGSQNIGFALPSNMAKSVVESVQKTGKIVRPYLGVRYIQITPEIKDKNQLTVDYGVLVSRGATREELAVVPGSPADKAGIVENDIILELDGQKLTEDHPLSPIIRQKKAGDTVTLKILSKGSEKTVNVVLAEMPAL